jgi:hypothetical protein
VKSTFATFALIALAAATVGLAQTTPQPQPAPSSQSSESNAGKADKQALMKDCVSQAQAANPSESKKNIKDQCTKQVTQQLNSQQSPHN